MRYDGLNYGDSFQLVYPNGTRGSIEWFPPRGSYPRDTEVIRLGCGPKTREQYVDARPETRSGSVK